VGSRAKPQRSSSYLNMEGVLSREEFLTKRLAERGEELERLRDAVAPFLRYYEDIRFNLRKQPHPDEAALEERGERRAVVTWAEFYALHDAMVTEQKAKP
jgi:hypothetical protein